jgi:hypothetical protein
MKMQHDERLLGNFDRGEFDAFLRQTERDLAAPPPADLSSLDDSVWRDFQKSCEVDAALAELPEAEEQTLRPRLRSERPDEEAPEDLFKSTGVNARKRATIADWLRRRVAAGEDVQDIIKASSSPSTAAIMQSIVDGGEL